jgi:hypothetical protein
MNRGGEEKAFTFAPKAMTLLIPALFRSWN